VIVTLPIVAELTAALVVTWIVTTSPAFRASKASSLSLVIATAVTVVLPTAGPEGALEPPPPPPQLIPPQGYVRLWIDIVDETKPAAATPGE